MQLVDRLHETVLPGEGPPAECRCDGGQPKNFLRPCLLLLLAEAPAHGYDLIERLQPFGFELSDPATVYRTLRQIEEQGLARSRWELGDRGPARRVYTITDDGRELLAAWTQTLASTRQILGEFVARVEQLGLGADRPPARKRDRQAGRNARNGRVP